jgi:glycosyltransferase involved in cell wall biosynthesis
MRVLHVFRSPVGGLFRHVCDLVEAQHTMGFETGIVCDTLAGGDYSNRLIANLQTLCTMGIARMPMPRMPAFIDFENTKRVTEIARQTKADVIHGHGSKGGLYARLAGRRLGKPSIYTPHGGVLNYEWLSGSGPLFLGSERYLAHVGSGFAFVCDYERDTFKRKIGTYGKPFVVVHNGLWPRDFQAVPPLPDATDLIFAGEMRYNKGVDLLLESLRELNRERDVTLTLAGDGVQFDEYRALASKLQLDGKARFIGRVPIEQAFAMGRIFVMPSRFESFPYVVMEAIAAEKPIVSTPVGGIPEVLPAELLTTAVDVPSLTRKLRAVLAREDQARQSAALLADHVKKTITVDVMAEKISGLYRELIDAKAKHS